MNPPDKKIDEKKEEFYSWVKDHHNDPDMIGEPNSTEERAAFSMWLAFNRIRK